MQLTQGGDDDAEGAEGGEAGDDEVRCFGGGSKAFAQMVNQYTMVLMLLHSTGR